MKRLTPRRLATAIVATLVAPPLAAQPACEVDHLYIGNRPKEANPGWHEEAQGITHDDTHWYVTQKNRLWKIPASHDLGADVACGGEVLCRDLEDTALGELGYDHLGDLTFHQGLLCVPVEFPGKKRDSQLALFRAADLELVARAPLPSLHGTAGWCAIDAAGFAYLSQSTVTSLTRFAVNWDSAATDGLEVTAVGTVFLVDEQGAPLELPTMQGGVFSDDGLLYLINGDAINDCDACGIHVFEVTAQGSTEPCSSGPGDCRAVQIDRSRNGEAPFDYEYNPGSVFNREEPEGITYWDLAAAGAPAVPGVTSDGQPVAGSQLHALMLDNDITNADDIYVKHYRASARCERLRYAAKILCGTQRELDGRLAAGAYATTINVHNPHRTAVSFAKSLALAIPPGAQRPGEVLPIAVDTLGPGQALAADCQDLRRRLGGELPGSLVDGFLILESSSVLDVTAVYTVNDLDRQGRATSGTSIDVERVPATAPPRN